ncbi:uncharacterized protein PAC_13696 [Phialocephala subalpina]|uniref:Uncharacterized protein n=1 Tax=Phialocephala subalpina TaxID=576137 RepID=A0A1L7XFH5_9HELO|nr:uncharacterized protein PAC_13696 [Phialocephala subalpina]
MDFSQPSMATVTKRIAFLFLVSLCSAAPLSPTPALPAHTRQVASATQCQGFDGNSDFYGLGIRIGVYLQWFSGLLANSFHAESIHDILSTNTIFLLALFIALAISTAKDTIHASEVFILLQFYFGFLFTVSSTYGLRVRAKSTSPAEYNRFVEFPVLGATIRACLAGAICSYNAWFWFDGVERLSNGILNDSVCPPRLFFFRSFDISNSDGMRIFLKITSVLLAIIFGTTTLAEIELLILLNGNSDLGFRRSQSWILIWLSIIVILVIAFVMTMFGVWILWDIIKWPIHQIQSCFPSRNDEVGVSVSAPELPGEIAGKQVEKAEMKEPPNSVRSSLNFVTAPSSTPQSNEKDAPRNKAMGPVAAASRTEDLKAEDPKAEDPKSEDINQSPNQAAALGRRILSGAEHSKADHLKVQEPGAIKAEISNTVNTEPLTSRYKGRMPIPNGSSNSLRNRIRTFWKKLGEFDASEIKALDIVPIINFVIIVWSILSIELMIPWNRIENVHSLESVGQLIPFVIGIVGFLKLLGDMSYFIAAEGSQVRDENMNATHDPDEPRTGTKLETLTFGEATHGPPLSVYWTLKITILFIKNIKTELELARTQPFLRKFIGDQITTILNEVANQEEESMPKANARLALDLSRKMQREADKPGATAKEKEEAERKLDEELCKIDLNPIALAETWFAKYLSSWKWFIGTRIGEIRREARKRSNRRD